MTIRSKTDFTNLYLTPTGEWLDNSTGDITPTRLRAGVTDFMDSQTRWWPLDSSGIIGSDSVSGIRGADFISGQADPPWKEGRVFYDSTNHTFAVYNDKSSVTLQLGQETHIRCVNKTSAIIPNGTAVALCGAQGNRPKIEPAIASANYLYIDAVIGVTTHDVAIDEEGLVTVRGTVDMDTRGFVDGDPIYLSPTISGGMTPTQPDVPNHNVKMGYALNTTVQGKILVTTRIFPDLEELCNVNGTTALDGYSLIYNGSSGYWDPTNISGIYSRLTHNHGLGTSGYYAKYNSASGFANSLINESGSYIIESGIVVFPKASGKGMMIDTVSPTYGWRDITSKIYIEGTATLKPTWTQYSGVFYQYQFGGGATPDQVFIEFHMPHDYALGTNMYIHTHWSNNVLASGNVQWTYDILYASGHGTASRADPFASHYCSISGVQAAAPSAYGHMIQEVQFSNVGGSGGLINTNILEVDGLILARISRGGTGSADTLTQNPFVHFIDLHYQSTNMPTKNRAPNFYS